MKPATVSPTLLEIARETGKLRKNRLVPRNNPLDGKVDPMSPKRLLAILSFLMVRLVVSAAVGADAPSRRAADSDALRAELGQVRHKIIYETWRDTNWELVLVRADGSEPVNLTRTNDVDELYPHVSNDGSKVCFVADEGQGESKVRSVYYMNLDGTGRTLVARNARQPFWKSDGSAIAYLKGASERFTYSSVETTGLFVFDLASGQHWSHPNKEISHLFGVCWSPDGNWFIATVHGGMGFSHAIVAIEAKGMGVFNLDIPGCRPEISPDGKRLAWTPSDWALRVADIDLSGPTPKVSNWRDVVTSEKPIKVYHIDWPPDGKYVAFTRGPATKSLGNAPEGVGVRAEGWNICVADVTRTNRWLAITSDGKSNKEPDWAPARP